MNSESTPAVESIEASQINDAVEMPKPNDRTIDAFTKDSKSTQTTQPSAANADPKPGELDAWNRPFDSNSFLPRKSKIGTWIPKGAGRKSKNPQPTSTHQTNEKTNSKTSSGSVVGETETEKQQILSAGDRFDAAAEIYTRAAYSITDGIMNGNGEWLPDNDGEHVAFRTALAAYLRAKNSEDLPPGAAFALAAASYAGKRVTRPNTATRIRLIGAWVKAKWQNWRNRKTLAALPLKEIRPEEKSPLPPIVEQKSDEVIA